MVVFLSKFRQELFKPVKLVVWMFLSAFIGFSGPFGSYMSMSLPVRFLYWSTIVASSIILVSVIKCLLYALRPNTGFWQHALLTSGIFSLIYTPLVHIGTRVFFKASEIYILPVRNLFVMVFAISVSIHAIKYSLTAGSRQNQPRLMRRLPEEIRAPILRLTVRDHHVDVFTEKGEVELRLRFADAVEEMEGVDGLCVHRSHWVTVAAVTGSERANGRIFLILRDGSKVPVSRKYRDNVASRGLI